MILKYKNQSEETLKIQLRVAADLDTNLTLETARSLINSIIAIIKSSNDYPDLDKKADELIASNKPYEAFLREAFSKANFAIGRKKPSNGWGSC